MSWYKKPLPEPMHVSVYMRRQMPLKHLFAWRHQAITWVIRDFSLARFSEAYNNFKANAAASILYNEVN